MIMCLWILMLSRGRSRGESESIYQEKTRKARQRAKEGVDNLNSAHPRSRMIMFERYYMARCYHVKMALPRTDTKPAMMATRNILLVAATLASPHSRWRKCDIACFDDGLLPT